MRAGRDLGHHAAKGRVAIVLTGDGLRDDRAVVRDERGRGLVTA